MIIKALLGDDFGIDKVFFWLRLTFISFLIFIDYLLGYRLVYCAHWQIIFLLVMRSWSGFMLKDCIFGFQYNPVRRL